MLLLSIEVFSSATSEKIHLLYCRVFQFEDVATAAESDFSFVNDPQLKSIIERNYHEYTINVRNNCDFSILILSGSIVEALLLDILKRDEDKAKSAASSSLQKKSIEEWDLFDLIDVAKKLEILDESDQYISGAIRNWRNLIHPGRELRKPAKITPTIADCAKAGLNRIIEQLESFK